MKFTHLLKASALLSGLLLSQHAMSANLVCYLNVKAGGNVFGNGTSNCSGLDFSFGNSTSGRFTIQNITKNVDTVIWQGDASCSGGTQCYVTVRAYSGNTTAKATILYDDGTWETTNSASMNYETGY